MQADIPGDAVALSDKRATFAFSALFHIGMLAVVFSCAYTLQPANYTKLHFATIAALAVAVIAALAIAGGRFARTLAGKALTALMAGIAYNLAYEPQIADLVSSRGGELALAIAEFTPSLGTIGLLVALVAVGLYLTARCDRRPVNVPLSWATAVAAGLVLLLGIIMYIALAPVYDLQGGVYTRLLVARVVEYGLLLLAILRMTGAPGVGSAPAWYLAVSLLAAAIRHIVGIGMP